MTLKIIFSLFILLQGFDLLSTKRALDSGRAHETNKLVAWLMDRIGIVPALLLKTAFAYSLGTWLYLHGQSEALGALVVFYGYFMYRNYKVLSKIKGP